MRTAVINNNIDPGSLGPLNLSFANQFKMNLQQYFNVPKQ